MSLYMCIFNYNRLYRVNIQLQLYIHVPHMTMVNREQDDEMSSNNV